MRALWSDRHSCSHNVSQKLKHSKRYSDHPTTTSLAKHKHTLVTSFISRPRTNAAARESRVQTGGWCSESGVSHNVQNAKRLRVHSFQRITAFLHNFQMGTFSVGPSALIAEYHPRTIQTLLLHEHCPLVSVLPVSASHIATLNCACGTLGLPSQVQGSLDDWLGESWRMVTWKPPRFASTLSPGCHWSDIINHQAQHTGKHNFMNSRGSINNGFQTVVRVLLGDRILLTPLLPT